MGFVLVWVLFLYSIVSGSLDLWDDPTRLICGYDYMQFSLPSLLHDVAFVLSVMDHDGKPHYLHNNSACSTWVGQDSAGSMTVGALFDSCYMKEEDGKHVMTISLEEISHSGKPRYHKKDLECPFLPAMDAPSNAECSAVPSADRIPCANTSVSGGLCASIGCCYTMSSPSNPCYYGSKLTVQCTEGNMVVVVSKDLTLPPLVLDSVGVDGVTPTSCPGLAISKTNSFVGFKFPLSCSAANQVSSDSITYESTLFASKTLQTWQGSSITRDSTIRLTVRCTYGKTGNVPLQVQVVTLPPPPLVSTIGPLELEMRIATDGGYNSYFADGDYPVVKVLRDPVYLEVRIVNRNDPNLVLILEDCWATNSANPTDVMQWPVLLNSCPFTGDNYLTQVIPVGSPSQNIPFPTHYQHFMVSTFTFVAPNTQVTLSGLVFFHCRASVCVPSATASCTVTCSQRKKRNADVNLGQALMVTSDGPIIFSVDDNTAEIKDDVETDFSSASMFWLKGAAAVGGVLGVILVTINLYRRTRNVDNHNCQL